MYNKIPESLHSFSTSEPFSHCIDCDRYLLDGSIQYLIEKAVRSYNNEGYNAKDVIFEYAICMNCVEDVKMKISNSSRQAIEDYITKHARINANTDSLRCIIHGGTIDEQEEYQISGLCQGDRLLMPAPVMIGFEALEQLQEVISAETKDEMDRMMGEFFGPPPELAEVLPNRHVPIII